MLSLTSSGLQTTFIMYVNFFLPCKRQSCQWWRRSTCTSRSAKSPPAEPSDCELLLLLGHSVWIRSAFEGVHLHGRALCRQSREAHYITEVNSDRIEGFGLHRLASFQLLRHRTATHRKSESEERAVLKLSTDLTCEMAWYKSKTSRLVLTEAGSDRVVLQLCVSPHDMPVSSLPPAPPGYSHTAPYVTADCPGCWSHSLCRRDKSK